MTLALRVASRYRTSRNIEGAGSEEGIAQNLPKFLQAMSDLSAIITNTKALRQTCDSNFARTEANPPWKVLIDTGRVVVDGILSTRSIPARDNKGLEMAYRLMYNSRRMPIDICKWWDTNSKRLNLIALAAKTWPAKQEGSAELFTLGSFRIHNTVGAAGSEMESLKNAIARAENLCRRNPIPGFANVLYGDIHVVNRITNAHHTAWYFAHDDSIYLRRTKKTGIDEVHALIHELGHRYWHNFAVRTARNAWLLHHKNANEKLFEVDMPVVGETLSVKIPTVKTYPTITRIEGGRVYFEFDLGGGVKYPSSISEIAVRDLYFSLQKPWKNFPTTYSSTNAEEHFCDALALLALGNLPAEHAILFNEVWNR